MIICRGYREVRLNPEADGSKLLKIHFIKFLRINKIFLKTCKWEQLFYGN